jgi:hypothetical protein
VPNRTLPFTKSELREFEKLRNGTGPSPGFTRNIARLQLQRFVFEKGEEKCNAMMEHLQKLGRWDP